MNTEYSVGTGTPIVCKGTSCENTVGDIVMDVITYGIYLACIVGGFAVYSSQRTVVKALVWVVVAGILGVLAWRFYCWRKRIAAMKAGVARLQAKLVGSGVAPVAAAPGAVQVEVLAVKIVLEPVKFRSTKTRAAMGASSGETTCAICLAALVPSDVVNELGCGHCYHRECLTAWVAVQPTCPSCRAPVAGGGPCTAVGDDVEMAPQGSAIPRM